VKNSGEATAQYSYVGCYLSGDREIDAGDTYLGQVYVPSLTVGSSRAVSATLTIPPGTAAGTYYVCAGADRTSQVAERDEGNNVLASPGQVSVGPPPLPDLVVTSVTAPQSGTAGGRITLGATVKNSGEATAQYSYIGCYLSGDREIDAGDTYLGQVYVPSLTVGSSRAVSATLTIPPGTAAGTYYVCAGADWISQVAERDESNNVLASPGQVAITAPPTPAPSPTPSLTIEREVEQAILYYTNQERAQQQLAPLIASDTLATVARAHSTDMKARNFFSHTNPDGLDPWERMTAAGYSFWCAAENIACTSSFTTASDPDTVGRSIVQDQWMQSAGHRANILGTCVTEIGVGVAYEPDRTYSPYGFIATQVFGKPR
jgi:uncharacterized protein YkwD